METEKNVEKSDLLLDLFDHPSTKQDTLFLRVYEMISSQINDQNLL